METKHKIDVLAGLFFSGLSITAVKVFGITKASLITLAYGYIFLGVFLALKNMYFSGSFPSLKNLIVIVEEEEKVLKKVWTGEKYEVDGELKQLS